MPNLHEAICGNYFIVKFLLKSNVTKVMLLFTHLHTNCVELAEHQILTLPGYLHILMQKLCTLFICFVIDDLFQAIFFYVLFQTIIFEAPTY